MGSLNCPRLEFDFSAINTPSHLKAELHTRTAHETRKPLADARGLVALNSSVGINLRSSRHFLWSHFVPGSDDEAFGRAVFSEGFVIVDRKMAVHGRGRDHRRASEIFVTGTAAIHGKIGV